MMNTLGRFIVLLSLLVFSASSLSASEEEFLWGFYQSKNKEFPLQFLIDRNGVSNVKVNSAEYPGTFRLTEHGIFGNTAFYQIDLKVAPERVEYICLLIFAFYTQRTRQSLASKRCKPWK